MGAEKEDRLYEDLTDMNKIQTVLQDYLDDYNMTFSKETKLVFFQDAIEHVSRCILANLHHGNSRFFVQFIFIKWLTDFSCRWYKL